MMNQCEFTTVGARNTATRYWHLRQAAAFDNFLPCTMVFIHFPENVNNHRRRKEFQPWCPWLHDNAQHYRQYTLVILNIVLYLNCDIAVHYILFTIYNRTELNIPLDLCCVLLIRLQHCI
jgi:hypothetical protein